MRTFNYPEIRWPCIAMYRWPCNEYCVNKCCNNSLRYNASRCSISYKYNHGYSAPDEISLHERSCSLAGITVFSGQRSRLPRAESYVATKEPSSLMLTRHTIAQGYWGFSFWWDTPSRTAHRTGQTQSGSCKQQQGVPLDRSARWAM